MKNKDLTFLCITNEVLKTAKSTTWNYKKQHLEKW